MTLSHDRKILFVGTADSLGQIVSGPEGYVPAVHALEASGYELAKLDKIEIPEISASMGVFTVKCHPSERIVFCTFSTKLLVAALINNSFQKFRVIDHFSDSPVYQTVLQGSAFAAYCPKEESFNICQFEEKEYQKSGSYQWNSMIEAEKTAMKVDEKSAPLLTKYSFSIPEFKNNFKFCLVDSNLGLMFVFAGQEIFKCVISRKSLILEDQSANYGIIN